MFLTSSESSKNGIINSLPFNCSVASNSLRHGLQHARLVFRNLPKHICWSLVHHCLQSWVLATVPTHPPPRTWENWGWSWWVTTIVMWVRAVLETDFQIFLILLAFWVRELSAKSFLSCELQGAKHEAIRLITFLEKRRWRFFKLIIPKTGIANTYLKNIKLIFEKES